MGVERDGNRIQARDVAEHAMDTLPPPQIGVR